VSDRLLDLLGSLFAAHPWHGVPAAVGPDIYNAFIEIVPTDAVKYELDKASGHLRLDRPQRFSSMCPTLYGFIPRTYCGPAVAARSAVEDIEGDGDPLDICVLTEKTVAHGNFWLHARPIGGLRMIDGNQADDKIVAVLEADLAYGDLRDIAACPRGVLDRLQHYFLSYKQDPKDTQRRVRIAEVYDRAEALEVIRSSLEDYRAKFGTLDARFAHLRALLTPA
jgi:inorganic pyrophosphatase